VRRGEVRCGAVRKNDTDKSTFVAALSSPERGGGSDTSFLSLRSFCFSLDCTEDIIIVLWNNIVEKRITVLLEDTPALQGNFVDTYHLSFVRSAPQVQLHRKQGKLPQRNESSSQTKDDRRKRRTQKLLEEILATSFGVKTSQEVFLHVLDWWMRKLVEATFVNIFYFADRAATF
jgi:hypothetical protein